jgi:hypothetical protein
MNVLEFENFEVKPTQEAFLIKPIRDLYNEDKSKNKEKFMAYLSVIYFIADPRSSYNYISDEEDRLQAIIEQEGIKNFKMTDTLKRAIEIYKQHTTTTSLELLKAARAAIDKIRYFLSDVDLKELDVHGKPVYTVSSITQALKQVMVLSKELIAVEKVVSGEIEEKGRAKGGNTKTLFDDGITL